MQKLDAQAFELGHVVARLRAHVDHGGDAQAGQGIDLLVAAQSSADSERVGDEVKIGRRMTE